MNVYEQVKQALQDIVAPELKALQVEIRRLDEKIDSKVDMLSNKIDSVKSEVLTEIKRLDEKIDGVDDKIEVAMQIRERLTALEVKLASMEK